MIKRIIGAQTIKLSKLKKKFDIDYNVIEAQPTIKYSKTRYNEATFIKALEKEGIGRPSTFSSLVSKIQEREYVKRENVEGVEYKSNEYVLTNNIVTKKEVVKIFGE